MVSALAWAVAAVCFALGFVALLMARGRAQFPSFALPLVWLVAVVAFALTTPTEPVPYFHAGGALGWGILTATGLWLVGALLSTRMHLVWLGASVPLLAPVLALVLVPEEFVSAVWGIGIATALAWLVLGRAWHEIESVVLGVLSLSWTTALAGYAEAPRWFGVCLSGAVIVALAFLGWRARKGLASWWLAHGLVFGGFTVVAVGYRHAGSEAPWLMMVLLALVAVTLARGISASEEWARYGALVWVALLLSVFGLMRGYGIALTGLMVCLYALVMGQGSLVQTEPRERALYTVGALLLAFVGAFRLFVVSYPLRAPRADLYLPFALFGFLLALVGLGVLALWWSRNREEAPLWRTALASFWAVVAPLGVVALFSERGGAGWLAGALGASLATYLYGNPLQRWLYPLAVAGVVVLLPLTEVAVTLVEAPRTTRIALGIGLGVAVLLTGIVSALSERRGEQ